MPNAPVLGRSYAFFADEVHGVHDVNFLGISHCGLLCRRVLERVIREVCVAELVVLEALHVKRVERRSGLHSRCTFSIFIEVDICNLAFILVDAQPLEAENVLSCVKCFLSRRHVQPLDVVLERPVALLVKLVIIKL